MTEYPAFAQPVEIRWSDQDLMGHVNNARILTLVEESRILWLRSLNGWDRDINPTVVVRTEINYRKPVMYGPELVIELGVGRIGGSSYGITFRGIQEEAVVFDGVNVLVGVDPVKLTPRQLSESELGILNRFGTFDPEAPTDLTAEPVSR
ncbi:MULTISPECIES: acyl-CoA thioesterase [Micrococcales]|uniref:acyl-CoA thioesterase n=1 Tax=Micrococcales TaxID=85006 RepID=UPI00068CA051|nr:MULTISPECIES: acyl-CoA thioesterase [Micrococcales]